MTIVITYTCDKCDHSQENINTPRQMWDIGISVEPPPKRVYQTIPPPTALYKAQWCRECILIMGLRPPTRTDKVESPKDPPTFEKMLIEIIQRQIEEWQL